jgi:diguanylate cyclase (GGDEF)-like protein
VESEREVNFIAYHDLLTRLPNRILFQDRLRQAIQLSARTGQMIGVVFADLDSFKYINDTMGHDLGDKLLVETAQKLTGALRRYDTVARFGGDEFMLLINQISGSGDLKRIMDHLIEVVRQPVSLSGQEFFVTMSAGVAKYPIDGQDAETLIKNADTAMYNAKALGKNRYELCSQDMKDKVLEWMQLSNLLYCALEKEQLMLYYQPILDIERRTIVGMEASVTLA